MKTLRTLFGDKDRKAIYYLIAAFVVGILLLIISNSFSSVSESGSSEPVESKERASPDDSYDSYEGGLERRLEDALSQVEGVGNVKVMITLAYGRETIVGSDSVTSQSSSKETDAGGGSRETTNSSSDEKTIVITDKSGENKPLVLKEVEPKVEGVIIVAEGGGDIYVKDALIKAASTVLGVEINKVQVLKMK